MEYESTTVKVQLGKVLLDEIYCEEKFKLAETCSNMGITIYSTFLITLRG